MLNPYAPKNKVSTRRGRTCHAPRGFKLYRFPRYFVAEDFRGAGATFISRPQLAPA
jgi:hypothetical protein